MIRQPQRYTLFPYTTLFRSGRTFHRGAVAALADGDGSIDQRLVALVRKELVRPDRAQLIGDDATSRDRKSTRLNSSHTVISYAVFCLKKKRPPRGTRLRHGT